MKNLFDVYSSLPHTRHFKKMDLAELKNQIENCVAGRNLVESYVGLTDDDPVRFALTFLKLIDLGAVPVPVSKGAQSVSKEISHLENLNWKSEPPSRIQKRSFTGYACLTSGTTGAPKKIHLVLENAMLNAKIHAEGFGLGQSSRIIQTLPIEHSYGIIAYIVTPIILGVGVDFCPGIVGLRSFKTISEQPRILHLSPSQARFIIKDRFSEPNGIAKISIGAGSLNYAELKSLAEKFSDIQMYVSYGLTEAGPRVTAGKYSLSVKEFSHGWIGSALNGIEVGVELDGKISEYGTGQLCIKTPCLMANHDPRDLAGEWLKTRDRVQINEDGEIYFISRADDIIKCGGISIYPSEMEKVVREYHPEISEVLVLKRKDEFYDEVPILFVEGKIERAALLTYINEHFSQSITPREVHILEKFPRASLNKIDRSALKAMMNK